MKHRVWFLAPAVALATRAGAVSQSPGTATDTVIVDINAGMTMMYDRLRTIVIALAQRIPAELWDFRPTSEVRTFAAAVGHAVTTNLNVCGSLLGRRHSLAGRHLDQTMTRKDELLPALESSFAFCDEYVRGLAKGQLSDSGFTYVGSFGGPVRPYGGVGLGTGWSSSGARCGPLERQHGRLRIWRKPRIRLEPGRMAAAIGMIAAVDPVFRRPFTIASCDRQ